MNEECVIDASLAVKLVLKREPLRLQARQLYQDAARIGASLIVPPVFESEVDSVISSRAFSRRLTLQQAENAWSGLDDLEVETLNPLGLRRRAREMAHQFNQQRVYDATYAALAELRGCEFWTADHAFYSAVKDELPFVKFLADYPLP
jgi:predicted nucleic acid-binding protein